MVEIGLTSVTFRKFEPLRIIQLAKDAGLQSIEWGADVHVIPGNLENAKRIGEKTREAGLKVAGYGSYFVAGKQDWTAFKEILQTAEALNAPIIRVWAGKIGSESAEPDDVEKVIECTRNICDMAAEKGRLVAYEYHPGTLTDKSSSALHTLQQIHKANMRLYWQPDYTLSCDDNCEALRTVLPYLYNVHAFYWNSEQKRMPLIQGREDWNRYARILEKGTQVRNVLMEFVKEEAEEQFMEDAGVLKTFIHTRVRNQKQK